MNISFDATAMLADMSRNRGIGNFASDWLENLIKTDKSNQYFCINMYNRALENEWEELYPNFHEVRYYSGETIEILRLSEYKNVLGKLIMDFIEMYDIDIFLIPSPFDPVLTVYEQEWFKNVRTIAVVHDIIPYIFKETYFVSRTIQKKYMQQVDMLHWMDKCLAVSNSTKNDMIQYLYFQPEKINVIGEAINSEIYTRVCLTKEEEEELKCGFGITKEFFLCTGGEDSRKNIGTLIEAYSYTSPEIRDNHQLVIVCKISEGAKKKYLEIAKKYGISDQIIFTGFISTDKLVKLYNLSKALLFPSKYEGFGLPVVEAWLCGTAVLTSDNSSLKELGEGAAVLVNAESAGNIARGIEQIANEKQNLIYREKGKERAKQYTWENVVKETMKTISQLPEKDKAVQKRIQKIAFFTPLPPLESGISDYSYDILCELSKYFDIDVFIDNGYEEKCKMPQNVKVYKHYIFADRAEDYDEIVYQVGGSIFHSYMFDYIKEYSGIVVLHDLNLHGILDFLSGVRKGRRFLQYKEALQEDMSEVEANAYVCGRLSNFSGSFVEQNPVNGFIVNYAKRIIVHTSYAKEKLLSKNILRNIAVIPHYAKTLRKTQSTKSDIIKFALFGRMIYTKRIMPVLKAFRQLIEEGNQVKLILAGKLDESLEKEFYGYLSRYSLQNSIELTGYILLQDFEKYIEKADICLNLRYPYMGETSGTLARIMGMGKCSIVNNVGSFSEIPRNACIKLPPVEQMTEKEEVDAIYAAMKKAMDYEERRTIGQNAYQYAQENLDICIVGKKYRDVITGAWKRRLSNDELHCLLNQKGR